MDKTITDVCNGLLNGDKDVFKGIEPRFFYWFGLLEQLQNMAGEEVEEEEDPGDNLDMQEVLNEGYYDRVREIVLKRYNITLPEFSPNPL